MKTKIFLVAAICTFAQTPCKTVVIGSTALCKGGNTVLTTFTTPIGTTYKYKWSTGDTTFTSSTASPSNAGWLTTGNSGVVHLYFLKNGNIFHFLQLIQLLRISESILTVKNP